MAEEIITVGKQKLGKAGEYLVAAQFLLNGFNVFFGAVDDGIDLVVKKKGTFKYVQVKTCQDIDYDSGKYMAMVNLTTLSRVPNKSTFIVFVLHYLSPQLSTDNLGNHTTYDHMYIVVPVQVLIDFIGKKEGSVVVHLYNSLLVQPEPEGWFVKMRYGKRDLILDDFVFSSFLQVK